MATKINRTHVTEAHKDRARQLTHLTGEHHDPRFVAWLMITDRINDYEKDLKK